MYGSLRSKRSRWGKLIKDFMCPAWGHSRAKRVIQSEKANTRPHTLNSHFLSLEFLVLLVRKHPLIIFILYYCAWRYNIVRHNIHSLLKGMSGRANLLSSTFRPWLLEDSSPLRDLVQSMKFPSGILVAIATAQSQLRSFFLCHVYLIFRGMINRLWRFAASRFYRRINNCEKG